jgi:2-phospho-L-lactate transferase/gluconeogenesis factor (CofD/UPF0052 family)
MHLIDVAVVNTRAISARQRRKYAAENVHSVLNDIDRLSEMGLQVMATDLLGSGGSVRHDPRASAEVALQLAQRGRAGRSKIRVLGER